MRARIAAALFAVAGAGGCFKVDTPRFTEGEVDGGTIDASPDAEVIQCTSGGAPHQSDDCPIDAEICDVDDTCRPCAAHDECDSGACYLDGPQNGTSCVPESSIAYVDLAASAANTDCTQDAPCRTIMQGVETHRLVILVAPGVYSGAVNLSHAAPGLRTLIAYGVELQRAADADQLTFTAGQGADFRVEGLTISGVDLVTSPAIFINAVSVELAEVVVQDSGGVGIDIENMGEAHIDRALIRGNLGGGIHVQPTGTLQARNIVVKDNGGASSVIGGIAISPPSHVLIAHATIVGNNCSSECEGSGVFVTAEGGGGVIHSSILLGNDTTNGRHEGNQFGASPEYSYCLVSPGSILSGETNVSSSSPDFTADGYHLATPGSPAVGFACPQGSGPPCEEIIGDDIDGDQRPVGGADIGADECVPDPSNQTCVVP